MSPQLPTHKSNHVLRLQDVELKLENREHTEKAIESQLNLLRSKIQA